VPGLPEVESVRRRIAASVVRARIDAVDLRRPDLRRPSPRHFVRRLTGQTVTALDRRAEYLVATRSSGETLLMHLGMSGSFRVIHEQPHTRTRPEGARLDPQDHVIFHMSSGRRLGPCNRQMSRWD
jgi:formamidopyrimidine-DNA glycosylase